MMDVTGRGDCARFGALLFGLAALLLASACAEVELVSHAAKQVQPGGQGHGDGHYKVGTPYQIDGIWYYPAVDYDYSETGIASWTTTTAKPASHPGTAPSFTATRRPTAKSSISMTSPLRTGPCPCPAWCE
jgi:hypothetical protein